MNRPHETSNSTIILLWPAIFGLVLVCLRFFILAWFGVQKIVSDHAIGIVLSTPGQVTIGIILALPLLWLRKSRLRFGVYLLLVIVVLVNVAAFHYEAVFWRLPGVSVLYYLREAEHLSSSTGSHAPWFAVLLETVSTSLILIAAAEHLLKRSASAAIGRWRPVVAASFGLLCVLTTLLLTMFPSIISSRYMDGSRVPLLWAAQSWNLQNTSTSSDRSISRNDVLEFQKAIGHETPFGGVDERYPLCGETPREAGIRGNGRSVIFLVLESVGIRQMGLQYEGVPVMPELERIALEATVSTAIKASGNKSSQAMPALFAGIPPQPAIQMLWRRPLNQVEGFPDILRRHGYRTVYVHGGDLSFEQQRSFLQMAGFDELIEYDISEPHPFLAWGYSDDVAFRKLRSWIAHHRESHPDRPYLGTLFTLSTHDPYTLPPDREPVFEGGGAEAKFVESLRFLDEQLGELYRWYVANEAPRGTVLVITGDHTPHLTQAPSDDADRVDDFDVPLIIVGEDSDNPAGAESIRGAQFDVPATILGAVGISPGRCDQGVDLLHHNPQSLQNRALYAVSGDQLEDFHLWMPFSYFHIDQAARTMRVRGLDVARLSTEDRENLEQEAVAFFEMTRRISSYLTENDAFAPPRRDTQPASSPLPAADRPRFIAHRGQSRGELPPRLQNGRTAVEQALEDGFEWIELDVQLSAEQVPVIVHDYAVIDNAGQEHDVRSLSLKKLRSLLGSDMMTLAEAIDEFGERANLLIEIKPPQTNLFETNVLTLRAATLVKNRSGSGEIIMDSFSPLIAESLVQQCDCEVGLDAPFMKPVTKDWLRSAASSGMNWIYIHFRQASPELIRDAHLLGLRVLVYTVNETGEIGHLEQEWPDAVITDRAGLISEFNAQFSRPRE